MIENFFFCLFIFCLFLELLIFFWLVLFFEEFGSISCNFRGFGWVGIGDCVGWRWSLNVFLVFVEFVFWDVCFGVNFERYLVDWYNDVDLVDVLNWVRSEI